MDTATPEGLAAEAEALWPFWAAHLAALAAGAQPADPAGSQAGARLAQVLEALWLDRGKEAAAAAKALWARALGREEDGLLASVASLSALLAAFHARPDPCLELAAATHLAILRCAALLPGSSSRQRLGIRAHVQEALEQLCFKACPQALLGALGSANSLAPPLTVQADPSLPHQALLLGNVLSFWRHKRKDPPGLTSLLEELEWVRGWVRALDALGQAGALTGPGTEMHEALVFICSRTFTGTGTDKPRQAHIMASVLEDPRLLPWYTEELLRCLRDELVSAAQGAKKPFRGHWMTLNRHISVWPQLRKGIAGTIAAQSRLQEWWLEALAALITEAEAACSAGAWFITWAPLSQLTDEFFSMRATETYTGPDTMLLAMAGFRSLHWDLHQQLLASNAAAAQRTEAAAVAAAHSCLRAAQAVEGWQGELAARKDEAFEDAIDAFTGHLFVLNMGPAFSCEAATSPSSPHVPGGRAVAAVMDVLQLAAEALHAVAGLPSLHAVRLQTFSRGGSVPVGICSVAADVVWKFLSQTLPGRQVQLIQCVRGEQVQPMVSALLRLLYAERKAVAWMQVPGRASLASPETAAEHLRFKTETCIYTATSAAMDLLARLSPSPGSLRRQAVVAHLVLPAAMAARQLPGGANLRVSGGGIIKPEGFGLAWLLAGMLEGGNSQWDSAHAGAAWLMCADVRSVVELREYTPAEVAQVLLAQLECINVEAAPTTAALTALASGLFSQLAGWAIRVARRPTNLLEPAVWQMFRRLDELLCLASCMADSLVLRPGEGARFAAANVRLSTQIIDALRTMDQRQLQSRKQLEAHGIEAAVRGAWERRRDQLLPAMERGARCGSAFVITWQPAGRPASGGGSEVAASAVPRRTCPMPAVQQALALAGVACANPLCTRLGSSNGGGGEAALERLQRCRGCRVAGYCCAACGREDWERHRPACNALRHLRRGWASVQPAVALRWA